MDDICIDLSVLGVEPADEYHAKAAEYLSSHPLIDFMICPWLYRKKQLGLIEDVDTPALLVGRGVHCRVLEGRDAYEAQFALGGPINKTTGRPYGKDTNAFRDWCKAQGKPGIHHDDLALIENMASGVAMNDEAVDLLLYGRSEGVVRAEYCGTSCQIRIDWTHPHRGIVDLKSTADLTWFENEARRRRYANQVAFYQAVLGQAIGELVPSYSIAIEKVEPFRCGVWRISPKALDFAQTENESAIQRLKVCQETGTFPTGYESIRIYDTV